MSKKLQMLKEIRHMLAKPEHWLQNRLEAHLTEDGRYLIPREDFPTNCWCLSSAIFEVSRKSLIRIDPDSPECETLKKTKKDIFKDIGDNIPTWPLPRWNDAPDRTHGDIMELLDMLISREEMECKIRISKFQAKYRR